MDDLLNKTREAVAVVEAAQTAIMDKKLNDLERLLACAAEKFVALDLRMLERLAPEQPELGALLGRLVRAERAVRAWICEQAGSGLLPEVIAGAVKNLLGVLKEDSDPSSDVIAILGDDVKPIVQAFFSRGFQHIIVFALGRRPLAQDLPREVSVVRSLAELKDRLLDFCEKVPRYCHTMTVPWERDIPQELAQSVEDALREMTESLDIFPP